MIFLMQIFNSIFKHLKYNKYTLEVYMAKEYYSSENKELEGKSSFRRMLKVYN